MGYSKTFFIPEAKGLTPNHAGHNFMALLTTQFCAYRALYVKCKNLWVASAKFHGKQSHEFGP